MKKGIKFLSILFCWFLLLTFSPQAAWAEDASSKTIVSWEWVDESRYLTEETDGSWSLPYYLEGASALSKDYMTSMPSKIRAAMENGEELELSVTWNFENIATAAAVTPALPAGYSLKTGVAGPSVRLIKLDAAGKENASLYVVQSGSGQWATTRAYWGKTTLFQTRDEQAQALQAHTVRGITPPGTTLNLFDYYVTDANSGISHTDVWSGEVPKTTWNHGINEDRLFLFGNGMVEAGIWNLGAGAGRPWGKQNVNMTGIVQSTLQNGFPQINLAKANADKAIHDFSNSQDIVYLGSAENAGGNWENAHSLSAKLLTSLDPTGIHIAGSHADGWKLVDSSGNPLSDEQVKALANDENPLSLSYLFDPDSSVTGKTVVPNVSGLFQLDDEGYYYYNARRNFAELKQDAGGNQIILYDSPAVWRTDGGYVGDEKASGTFTGPQSVGNFYPFNKGAQVFDALGANGKLASSSKINNNDPTTPWKDLSGNDVYINHHIGMSMQIDFRQPINGKINMGTSGPKDMTFEFSGDDDVWIYIDDVLVLDLGGIHSELFGTINFATGEVRRGQSWRSNGAIDDPMHDDSTKSVTETTTLHALFEAAGMEDTVSWVDTVDQNGNASKTFASDTSHTLKMFYLERGNYDSSLYMRFNLQFPLYQSIKKVDQDGNPLAGVGFALYPADSDYQQVGSAPVCTLVTDGDGIAQFKDTDDQPYRFADAYNGGSGTEYYILKETNPPAGYRTLPQDIILRYEPSTAMLVVVNNWTTGAYASFTSTVLGNNRITYGQFNELTGDIEWSTNAVSSEIQQNGLVLAVPMLLQKDMAGGADGKWVALYGSNTNGFNTVIPGDRTALEWRTSILEASLYQCLDETTPHWYLEWNDTNKRLEGKLTDLPGRADRYQLNSGAAADMRMVYGVIEPTVFANLSISSASSSGERYDAFAAYVRNETAAYLRDHQNEGKSDSQLTQEAIQQISRNLYNNNPTDQSSYDPSLDFGARGFSMLNVDQFSREFRSLIYIPNEQRELRVRKVDEDGLGVNGAVFHLINQNDASDVVEGITATVDGVDGMLIFRPSAVGGGSSPAPGYAYITWANNEGAVYTLKEVRAPAGHELNDTPIPVVVGIYSIYADAGTPDNGVTVMAGAGKLVQTMVKYASDETVNITLRDITVYAQEQESGHFDINGWNDVMLEGTTQRRFMNLHYGKNAVVSYGLHDVDGGGTIQPFFVTDTGFLRARVEQNWVALTDDGPYSEGGNNSAKKENLTGMNLTGLFSLLNTVVVTDKKTAPPPTGELALGKTVTGNVQSGDYTRNFRFTLSLSDSNGQPLPGEYYFFGTNKAGYVSNGSVIPLHHDESITILGLPEGTQWRVSEENSAGWYVVPGGGTIGGVIEEDQTTVAAYENSRQQPGQLQIRKTVAGSEGETDRDFTFKLTFSDKDGNALPNVFAYVGDKTGSISSGGTLTLRHGQSVRIALPAGTKYTVAEQEADSDGYVTTASGEAGVISQGHTATASFTNTKQGPTPDVPKTKVKITKVWQDDGYAGRPDSITVRVTAEDDPTFVYTKTIHRDDISVVVSKDGNTWTFYGEWNQHSYRIEEIDVPGYASSIDKSGNEFVIINTYMPQTGDRAPIVRNMLMVCGGLALLAGAGYLSRAKKRNAKKGIR